MRYFCLFHFQSEFSTLQMFTGIYRVIKEFFCNICRENPMITIGFPCNLPAICKYYRVFPADIAEKPLNHPVIPCKHLQCTEFWLSMLDSELLIWASQLCRKIPPYDSIYNLNLNLQSLLLCFKSCDIQFMMNVFRMPHWIS